MNTVERVLSLCKEQHVAISRLEKALGFSNGYIKGLKKGTLPNDRLTAIAEYLGVSEAYLSQGTESTESVFVALDNSMEPLFVKHDVITYQEGTNVKTEGLAVVRVGNAVLLRRVKRIDTGLVLVPCNMSYGIEVYTYQEIQQLPVKILGRAKSMQRSLQQ